MTNAITYNWNLATEAESFIRQYYEEKGLAERLLEARLSEVTTSIRETGTYAHTKEELVFGAKVAWRNNAKCIGRLFWDSLEVFDEREARTEDEIAAALLRHLEYATNGGRIRPALTAFAPRNKEGTEIRIWNHQLVRYAGYRGENGIVGDPSSVELTEEAIRLGWRGRGTPFDVLPLLVQIGGGRPKWYPIPDGLVKEVELVHPEHEAFAELGLKWYAVPILSDLALRIGGLTYTAAPFNGWYMGTEIGARNLADENRYGMLPAVADNFGWDRVSNTTLWKDRALVELNAAVIHSYKLSGVSIVDHHTAAEQFMLFMRKEREQGREANARWSWLIPPMSPAATPIWHDDKLTERTVRPDYAEQKRPY